jgi:hypothetical protein
MDSCFLRRKFHSSFGVMELDSIQPSQADKGICTMYGLLNDCEI